MVSSLRSNDGDAPTIANLLKSATRVEHRAIESAVGLMNDHITLADYRAYLLSMLGYVEPVEAALCALSGWDLTLPDFSTRLKTSLLRADLTNLGALSRADQAATICGALPPTANMAEALGVMYVLEGSTLGGRIIARHLSTRLDVTAAWGASYLLSYGDDLGLKWRIFGVALQGFVDREGHSDDIVLSAQRTFETLQIWLTQGAHP